MAATMSQPFAEQYSFYDQNSAFSNPFQPQLAPSSNSQSYHYTNDAPYRSQVQNGIPRYQMQLQIPQQQLGRTKQNNFDVSPTTSAYPSYWGNSPLSTEIPQSFYAPPVQPVQSMQHLSHGFPLGANPVRSFSTSENPAGLGLTFTDPHSLPSRGQSFASIGSSINSSIGSSIGSTIHSSIGTARTSYSEFEGSHSETSRASSPTFSDLTKYGYLNMNGTWSCNHQGCSSKAVFTRGCDLRKHHKRHTKSFFCDYEGCSQQNTGGFSSKKDLARHQAKHNPGVVCEHEGCDRVFSRVDNMRDHVKRIHKRKNARRGLRPVS